MAATAHGGPGPDLYQLLGVARGASREEIAQAWRRRARAEHPDSRPRDTAAADRFRALAEAYQVLSDPARRAAYDRALAREQLPGPVLVEGTRPAPAAGGWDEQDIRLAVLAELALRCLARDRGWPR
jgi:molecular chaperone DnaJ